MKTKSAAELKIIFTLAVLVLIEHTAFSQTQVLLTIDSCYMYAKNNYPLIKQQDLISKTATYSLANSGKNYLPQVSINGQATYQSDVTQIPIKLPNMNIPVLEKDQYKMYGEIIQPLTDIAIVRQQRELIKSSETVETDKLEVELYKLKERVNQLFFGMLMIDAQLQQTELLQKDVQSGIDKTTAAIANGTALKSNLNMLKAEQLKVAQRTIELKMNRQAFADMLSLLINKPVTSNTMIEIPPVKETVGAINRLEVKLFDNQKKSMDIQQKIVNARTIPRLGLFVQGGYGRPALNMLLNEFDFYYIGGLRLNWNLSSFYTLKKDKQLLHINQDFIDIQKQTFLFNTQLLLAQQQTEFAKLKLLIATDDEIIALRESIKTTANAQLENGTITAIDYVTYINAADQAKQNLLIHKMQLLMTQYTTQNISGN